jgi:hypothetical protein
LRDPQINRRGQVTAYPEACGQIKFPLRDQFGFNWKATAHSFQIRNGFSIWVSNYRWHVLFRAFGRMFVFRNARSFSAEISSSRESQCK